MNWDLILKAGGPILISFLQKAADAWLTPVPPSQVDTPQGQAAAHAEPVIMELQQFLNIAVKPNPPLAVDGWLGPETKKAIHTGIVMLKQAGYGV